MLKLISLTLLLTLSVFANCEIVECDAEKLATTKANLEGLAKHMKSVYENYSRETATKMIANETHRRHKENYPYKVKINDCKDVKVEFDVDHVACETWPNPNVYDLHFRDAVISMNCYIRAEEVLPFKFNRVSDGRLVVKRPLKSTVKYWYKEIKFEYGLNGKTTARFDDCPECYDYSINSIIRYFQLDLWYGDKTNLTVAFQEYLKSQQEDKSLRLLQ